MIWNDFVGSDIVLFLKENVKRGHSEAGHINYKCVNRQTYDELDKSEPRLSRLTVEDLGCPPFVNEIENVHYNSTNTEGVESDNDPRGIRDELWGHSVEATYDHRLVNKGQSCPGSHRRQHINLKSLKDANKSFPTNSVFPEHIKAVGYIWDSTSMSLSLPKFSLNIFPISLSSCNIDLIKRSIDRYSNNTFLCFP